jgi:hypothetical protein
VGEHDERRGPSRRTFLIQLAAMGATGSLLASCARAVAGAGNATSPDMIGLQMYTVRDLLAKDFEGT